MAGTIPLSMTQQFDSEAKPLVGGLLYTIVAGTTSTPQTVYQDSGLTIEHPNPITLDSAGRIPQFFCDDGSIKVRLTNSAGVAQLVADNILVVGPSGGGGGGSSVDPTTILATGDFKMVYGTGSLTGFVRANGRTIGNATSGASERANADTSALFAFLWNADPNLSVSTGRGASAAADYAAGKTIVLPDCRGRSIAGLDDMGNSAASRLTATYFGSAATTLGAAGGSESKTLVTANLPPYTPSGTNASSTVSFGTFGYGTNNAGSSIAGGPGSMPYGTNTGAITGTAAAQIFTGTAQGGTSTAFAVASPAILMTIYIKL